MPDNYVRKLNYTLTAFKGCCGAGVLSRLNSPYRRNKQQAEYYHERLMEPLPMFPSSNGTAKQYLDHARSLYIPVEIAFGVMLGDIRAKRCYALYALVDNISEAGDYIDGCFTTRAFARWIRINDLGTLVSIGPVPSRSTGRSLQGWMWTPNWNHITREIITPSRQYVIDTIKEINNSDRLKALNEERHKQRSDENRRLQAVISQW